MKLIYIHTGKFPSNSPSMTFVLYNAMSLSNEVEKFYLFIKDNLVESTEYILKSKFQLSLPSNLFMVRIKPVLGLKTNLVFFIQVYLQITKLLKVENIDAVITRSTKFLPWLVRLKKKSLKVFYETHDFFADLSITDKRRSNMQKRLEKYEQKYIPYLDGVFCLQESQINLYKNAISNFNKFYLVRTGINKIYKTDFSSRKYLAYIGSFESNKGIEDLLKSFSQISVQNKLLLIGGKNKREINSIEKIIISLNLSERVIVTGWLDKEKIYELLKETLIGIVPLLPTFFNKYLTSPLKIFDYFSCGIPVLTADLPTTRELVEENQTGFFYEAGNQIAMREKLILSMERIDDLNRISNNIYQYAETLLWGKRAKIILSLIRNEHYE